MHKTSLILTALAAIFVANPALADDAAMDVEPMVEQSAPKFVEAITPVVRSFDIKDIGNQSKTAFMATMASKFEQSFRFAAPAANLDKESTAGLTALLIPEEFAFRSTAQDTGVDGALPGQYVSNSIRSDYLPATGPAARDKSSFGIRLGF